MSLPAEKLELIKHTLLSHYRVGFVVRHVGCCSKLTRGKEEDIIQDKAPAELYNYYDLRGGRDKILFEAKPRLARYHVYRVFKFKDKGNCVVQWVGYSDHRPHVTIESIKTLKKIAPDKLKTHLKQMKQTPNMGPWGTAIRIRC